MDALQSRGMSLDRAEGGKCILRGLSRPPAPRDVLLRGVPGDAATHGVVGFTLRGNQKQGARPQRPEDATPPSSAKVAPGW